MKDVTSLLNLKHLIYVHQRRSGTFLIKMSKASLFELCYDEKKLATYHSTITTVKVLGRSAWEYLGKFFTKSLIKRVESSLLALLSVKTLSNIFNGC